MNYSEIKDSALKYSMRTDPDTADMVDTFLRIVEARMNTSLDCKPMMFRAVLETTSDQQYYAPPLYFLKLRDIQVNYEGGDICTPVYVAPEEMNKRQSEKNQTLVYTIIANQFQIFPMIKGQQIEIVFQKRMVPLSTEYPWNWASELIPNAYIFGVLVEICNYAKDPQEAQMWDARFRATLEEFNEQDAVGRWSGPSLRIQIG